ncbi:hypothetical protein IWX63_000887 [Arthrobacter sp. CAN_A2]|uniref:hypothetical protein n=1 Tax=Arthrobacter sp. CAN_A2 TaxID=2787718 RepID=UPI0018EF89EB
MDNLISGWDPRDMWRPAWVGLIGITLGLAGCSNGSDPATSEPTTEPPSVTPGSVADSEAEGELPPEAITAEQGSLPQEQAYPFPEAGWLEGGAKFAIVLVGSSSCPAFPSSIEVIDAHRLMIGIDSREGEVCTADMVPRTHVLRTPADIDSSQEVTLEYSFGRTVILPPL